MPEALSRIGGSYPSVVSLNVGVVKMVDAGDLKSPGVIRAGSTPVAHTKFRINEMRYAIISHILAVVFMIFTYRWLNGLFPVIADYRTWLISIIAVLWFMVIYKGIQWTGKKLDQIDNRRG